jgi:acyl carrier protein
MKACIVGVPNDISHEVPVAVFDHTKAPKHITKLDMQQVLVSELGAPYALASILTLEEIGLLAFPVGPGGKIQKPRVREFVLQALADGNTSSQQQTTVPPGSLKSKVYAIVASHLGVDVTDLSPTLSLSGLLDSLTATRLLNTLEKLLGRRLALSTTARLDSIEQIVRLCEASNGRSMIASSSSHSPPQLSNLSFLARKELATFELLQQTVHASLAPLHMDWGHHVQDIFKVPFLYSLDLFAGAKDRGFLRRIFEINNPSSRYITQAIGRWLEHYHIFRSFAIEFENQPLLIRVKPCLQFRRACISYATIQDTETETFCDQAMASAGDQACKPPGTLIKIQIVSVANTAKSLLVLTVSHAVVDAVMMEPCLRDLDALLANLEAPLGNDLVDYKLWADMYDNLEESRTARDSAEYHAQYLRGFSKLSDAVWPSIHRTTNGTARRDSATSSSGDIGRIHEHKFEHLPYLFAEHGIRPATVLKAAVALANSRTTGHAQATFVDTNAGRVWPFQDAFVQTSLPNAWNVMGPTYTALFNIISIDMNGTCLKLLQDVHASTAEATAHCHTSLPAVLGKLGEEAALVTEFFTRQTLNITPDVRRFLAYRGLNNALVQKRIKAFTISPGVYWQCSFYDGDTLAIAVRADAGVVDVELAERMRRDIVHCMGGLCKPGVEARLLRDIA